MRVAVVRHPSLVVAALRHSMRAVGEDVLIRDTVDEQVLSSRVAILLPAAEPAAAWLALGQLLASYYRGHVMVPTTGRDFRGLEAEGVSVLDWDSCCGDILRAARRPQVPARPETARRVAAHRSDTLLRIAAGDRHALPAFEALRRLVGGDPSQSDTAKAELETAKLWIRQFAPYPGSHRAAMEECLSVLSRMAPESPRLRGKTTLRGSVEIIDSSVVRWRKIWLDYSSRLMRE